MGEIAEDMADGTMCSICGQYFQDLGDNETLYTHGYPVACKGRGGCFRGYMRRQGIQKALVKCVGE